MGYYTNYYLEIIEDQTPGGGVSLETMLENFPNVDECVATINDCADEAKWHEHEIDMAELSAAYPDVVFQLSGKGEEWDDFWKKTFKAGKVKRFPATVTIEYPNAADVEWSEPEL